MCLCNDGSHQLAVCGCYHQSHAFDEFIIICRDSGLCYSCFRSPCILPKTAEGDYSVPNAIDCILQYYSEIRRVMLKARTAAILTGSIADQCPKKQTCLPPFQSRHKTNKTPMDMEVSKLTGNNKQHLGISSAVSPIPEPTYYLE